MSSNKFSRLTRSLILSVLALGIAACSSSETPTADNLSPINTDDNLSPINYARTDMNGDGLADLVLEYGANNSLNSFQMGFGVAGADQFDLSSFTSRSYNTIEYSRARAIAVADANNDGKDDLLVQLDTVDGYVDLRVLLTDNSGLFNEIELTRFNKGSDTRALAFNDINGDGFADVLISQQAGGFVNYTMLLANPAGGYNASQQVYSFDLSMGRPEIVALEDVNNDGKADLVLDMQIGSQHCYTLMVFNQNGFFEQPYGSNCINYYVPNLLNVLSSDIADLDGDGRLELIVSYQYQHDLNDIRTDLVYFIFGECTSGCGQAVGYWYPASSSSLGYQLGEGDNRIVAIADLNNDDRADVLYEKTLGTTKEWWVFLTSEALVNPGRSLWMSGLATDNTQGLRDYNGDGFLDLLIDATDTTLSGIQGFTDGDFVVPTTTITPIQKLYVALNDNGNSFNGNQFDSTSNTPWHEDVNTARIVGLEEHGLTSVAHDRTELIAWAGVADTLYTHDEFSQLLALKGLALAPVADIVAGNPLPQDQCTINYSKADATRSKYNVGAEAEFGMLVCNIKLGDRASIRTQMIYGGCNATDGLNGASAKCEVGTFNAKLELDLSPAPNTTLGIKGPNAEACGGVSTSNVCANLGAEFASTSAKVEAIGVGGEAKLAIGVGAGADFSIEDGVISGKIDLKFLVGGSIEFSLDPAETGKAFYKVGESTYLFAEDAGEVIVLAAGPVIYDAASAASDGTREVANLAAGDAVYVASETGSAVVVIFEDVGEEMGVLFTSLSNAADSAVDGFVDFAGDVGDGIVDVFCFGFWC